MTVSTLSRDERGHVRQLKKHKISLHIQLWVMVTTENYKGRKCKFQCSEMHDVFLNAV